MMKVCNSTSPKAKHLLYAAYYNIGRAYFQGYGIRRCDDTAERWVGELIKGDTSVDFIADKEIKISVLY